MALRATLIGEFYDEGASGDMNLQTPAATVSLLVAGNRSDRLSPEEIAFVERAMERVLQDFIRATAQSPASDKAAPPLRLRVITGTSTGVDHIAARAAAEVGLPLHIIGFAADADSVLGASEAAQRLVLLPALKGVSEPTLDGMVSARDEIALSYSDFLVVVWDGGRARGYSSGTFRLMRDAAILGRPVVVIGLDQCLMYLPSLALGDAARKRLSYLEPDPSELQNLLVEYRAQDLHVAVAALAPPRQVQEAPQFPDESTELNCQGRRQRLGGFVQPGLCHEVLTALLRLDGRELKKVWGRDPNKPYYGVSADELPPPMGEQHPVTEPEIFRKVFEVHDLFANRYAGLHRDVTWIVYGLSAVAVFAAVAGAIGLAGGGATFWGGLELFTLLGILVTYTLAKRGAWHERWMSHRYSAELIRYARVGLPVLATPEILQSDTYSSGATGHGAGAGETQSEAMALRRMFIDQGLPAGRGDAVIYKVEEHLGQCLAYCLHVISDQIRYHEKKAHENHRTSHALHWLTQACFLITGLAIIGHFFLHAASWLLMTAALPAFAAALHGISTQNEYVRLVAMSKQTVVELCLLRSALENCGDATEHKARNWLLMRCLVAEAIRCMSGSAGNWRELVLQKAISLPA